jgi:hypothetical protein
MTTKLGLHISSGPRGGFGDYLAKCQPTVVFSVGQDVMPDVKKYSPATKVIFRTQFGLIGKKQVEVNDGPDNLYTGDPETVARDFMALVMPVWAKNKADYYAPLNEQDPGDLAGFKALNDVSIEMMKIAESNGYKLALYAFSVGNPKNLLKPNTEEILHTPEECWEQLIPSLEYAKANGHILLLHEYGADKGTLSNSAPFQALRYRKVYAYLPDSARAQLVISEASSGVGYKGNEKGFVEDALWYGSELDKDQDVIGCCLYQVGGSENMKAILPALADAIMAEPIVVPPAPVNVYRVVCTRLNIRKLPNTSSMIVGVLSMGQTFQVTEKATADWYLWGKTEQGWVALIQIPMPLTEQIA